MNLQFVALAAALALASGMSAQVKPTLQPKDYGQWETIAAGPGSFELSPDGKWMAYQVTHSSRDNELRITPVAGGETTTVPFGRQPVFSSDSHWLAYKIGFSESATEKLRKDKKPVREKLGIMDLSSPTKNVVENVDSFAMSPDGKYLAMRRYAPEKAGTEGKDTEADVPVGAALVVRELAVGKDTAFGNVAEYAWQDMPKTGHLLALTISGEEKTGNAVQLFDPAASSIRVLDSSTSTYTGLSWRKKSADLAVLRTLTNDKQDGPSHGALAWTGLGTPVEKAFQYDPSKDSRFPAGMRTVSYRRPSWSDDSATVFVGMSKWNPAAPAKKDGSAKPDDDEAPTVDVWHWRDPEVLSLQKTRAQQFAHRNMIAAWNLREGSLVPLSGVLTEQVAPLRHSKLSYAEDWTKYAMERSIGRPAIDLFLVDNATGVRTPIGRTIRDDQYLQSSASGKYLIYLQDDHYWTVNTATKQVTNITKDVPTTFIDRESDFTVKQKPPFGIAGWTADDAKVILYDKYDMWLVSPDSSGGKRLTDGAKDEVRHTYINLDRESEFIDAAKPIYVRLFGVWSKKSGFATLNMNGDGTCKEEHITFVDQNLDRLTKARDADTFAYLSQSFTQSPNIFVGAATLKDSRQVTNTNPNQSKYAWGHEELVDYKNSKGEHLQAGLFYPADYQAGKQYPMVVYIYEKLSDNLHRYVAPSERDYYNIGALTQQGYFALTPDIVFKAREPGLSVVDCVGAAVKKVISMGAVDPKRVGVMGHSWGGFDTAFLATHSNIFAAAVAGAPITDLVSNYGNHHWSSGIAETDHIETGQQRMEVPLFEDLQAYIRNSAVFNVQNMTTPLLIEVGDSDGTVFYHQGVELYNIARRAKKNVVLLVYNGEDHGLRKKADQIDYHRRIVAWFDHYLKDAPAQPWITEGESYQQHQLDLKMSKAATKPPAASAQ